MDSLTDPRELHKYKLLIKKTIVNKYNKVMLAGLEAVLASISDNIDIDKVKNQLYKYLDNSNPTLNDYLEISRTLETINSPVTVDQVQYVVAGIDSFNNSQELLKILENNKLDFLVFFKVFAKFMSDAAEVTIDPEIDSPYAGISEDNNISDEKRFSKKYKFLAKLLKLLAHILLINAYIAKAIANGSTVLNHHLQNLYKNTIYSLRKVQSSVSKSIDTIDASLKVMSAKTNELFHEHYNKLLENYTQLGLLLNKLKHQVKVNIITNALNNDHTVFAPLFDPNNRDIFIKIAQNTGCDKQDQFSGLTGIINTRLDLRHIRNAIKGIIPNINDALLIDLFTGLLAIAQNRERHREAQRYSTSDKQGTGMTIQYS